jgi:hypothetical protein
MKNIFNTRVLLTAFLLISSVVFINHYTHFFEFTQAALGKYFTVKWFLMGHIVPAAVALLIGPFQFIKQFRKWSWKLHRLLGKLYMLCILCSATGAMGLILTTTNAVSKMYTVSVFFMLMIWVVTTFMAYLTIIKKQVKEHEDWTVRSYIVTFAFIIQNYVIKIPFIMDMGSFAEVSPNIFWFSWAVPLMGFQVYLSVKKMAAGASKSPQKYNARRLSADKQMVSP